MVHDSGYDVGLLVIYTNSHYGEFGIKAPAFTAWPT